MHLQTDAREIGFVLSLELSGNRRKFDRTFYKGGLGSL